MPMRPACVGNTTCLVAVLLVGAAGSVPAGAKQGQGIQCPRRDSEGVRAEALREAATKARAEAEVLASALGLKVVRILTVEESSPRVVPVRAFMAGAVRTAAAAPAPPVESGTLDVTADVVLTVEVSPAAH